MSSEQTTSLYDDVYLVLQLIPEGKVATYGQIARLIGRPRHARQVGYALASLPSSMALPWHRVINSKGEISSRSHPDYENYQQILLEEEGIVFSSTGRISLKTYQWDD